MKNQQRAIIDPKTVYFCVDLEASGRVPGLFNMVSIGGVAVQYDHGVHRRGGEFYFELQPICDGFDPHAMSIHGLTEDHLRTHGLPARLVMEKITDWVKTNTPDGYRPLFVGHNAPFDWMFTAWYFAWAGLDNPFGYNALDTKALMMGTQRLPWRQCNKETLTEVYPELRPPAPDRVHNALADAQFQADILIALLDGNAPNRRVSSDGPS
ncbi:MAG: 3'-5' exonuclease [Myxococcota bacterium]|nr:3'-5' exonuclease [Myxococcota bacterium]